MANRVMTEGKIAKAKEMKGNGETYQKIADSLGVNQGTIRYHLDGDYKERILVSGADHYADNIEEKREQHRVYAAAHVEEKSSYDASYYAERKEDRAAYRASRKEELKIYFANYGKTHRAEHNAHNAARRALKAGWLLGATAAQKAEINELYRRAKEEPNIRCYLCGDWVPLGERHVDHIEALTNGGSHRASNLAVSCSDCNLSKGGKTLEEMGLLL